MAPSPTTAGRIEEARGLAKTDPAKAESTLKEILAKGTGSTEASSRDYENALVSLGELYRDQKKPQEIAELIKASRDSFSSFAKAKTAKLVRQLLDLFSEIPNTLDIQVAVIKSCIDWAVAERRSFLRQNLETRLVAIYMQKQTYYDALTLINSLLRELKRLDDKLMLVEVQLLESRVYHALGNQAKARAALTAARTSAASVYTPPNLQAGLDMQSGMLHAEDKDFNTSFSYFIEALEGYSSLDESEKATAALQYMLLCKIMLNLVDDVTNLLGSKQAQKYASPRLEAMKAVARAHADRSLEQYEKALSDYRFELGSDAFIRNHLRRLYDAMLEQNLIKVIEPFSRVELDHIAKMVGLDTQQVERKLSQMILDKVIIGVLDQGAGCLIVFDETERDQAYDAALETIAKLSNVVEELYTNQASQLDPFFPLSYPLSSSLSSMPPAMNAPIPPNYGRGFPPQAAQRSPATPRRGPQAPVPMAAPLPQHGVPPQLLPIQQRNMMAANAANEAALRRSRKPTDKNIPEGIEEVVIGEGVQQYKSLRDLEKRLDAAIVRKRLDIQDSISKTVKKYRTMRIWISNTVENQPWQNASGQNGATNPGSGRYKVRIEGRLLDDDSDPTVPEDSDEEDAAAAADDSVDANGDAMEQDGQGATKTKTKAAASTKRSQQRFSHFFKSITIDFDRPATTNPEDVKPITWNKPQLPPNAATLPPTADFDSLQFSRASQENLNVTVSLVRDETPERYKLSKELAEVLDVEEETRSGIVLGIWDYIRAMGLQEDEEKRLVRCDHRLRSIFGRDQMFFPQIPDSIGPHTSPIDPIKLPYTIRVDADYHNDPTPTVYDIQVALEDPLRSKMIALTQNPQYTAAMRQISTLDDQVALIVQALTHSRARHSFFTALSKDPATFLRRWVNSQRRDLETILGEATRGGGEDASGPEFRRGGTDGAWDTPVAREAVRYMLAKPEVAMGRVQ
ncbi:PCI-domain-containing protein [Aspergillus saccharolyticus JOP 1030-1]|uniref:PCI-domain-containing protein n=1 Tax=Aspergillus saccharolyticus JOP 1030-1 TaxID=1450539 RepID=A0A318Z4X0_9EURO|nr:PCI-domain-containing protein [Aspergillus saccharolyticus JOP 1030-1]PYH41494.1 PCI-domain-containing protein [Aspergillus saccharolyticus JOP 1030-1]